MKFCIACDEFSQMLSRLQGFLSRKPLSPVLSNVLLQIDEQGLLHLSATDLEISFHGTLQVKDQAVGAITVDGKRLYAMIKQLPEEEVFVEVNEKQDLLLSSGRSEMSLSGIDAEEFPEIQHDQEATFFDVKGGLISELFDRAIFSSSNDESRPNLNGVYFQSLGDGICRAVSTDGHRLTLVERQISVENGAVMPKIDGQIIPRKGVAELKRLLEEYPEVKIALSGQNWITKTSDFSVSIRLIAEKFPPYEAVIPKSNDQTFIFNRGQFLNTLKRMGLVGEEKLHGVRLDFQGDEVLLESSNVNLGQVTERLKLGDGSSDTEITVSFSVQYMLDILNVTKGESIELNLGQAERIPGIFKDPDYPQDTFVVMPRRL